MPAVLQHKRTQVRAGWAQRARRRAQRAAVAAGSGRMCCGAPMTPLGGLGPCPWHVHLAQHLVAISRLLWLLPASAALPWAHYAAAHHIHLLQGSSRMGPKPMMMQVGAAATVALRCTNRCPGCPGRAHRGCVLLACCTRPGRAGISPSASWCLPTALRAAAAAPMPPLVPPPAPPANAAHCRGQPLRGAGREAGAPARLVLRCGLHRQPLRRAAAQALKRSRRMRRARQA